MDVPFSQPPARGVDSGRTIAQAVAEGPGKIPTVDFPGRLAVTARHQSGMGNASILQKPIDQAIAIEQLILGETYVAGRRQFILLIGVGPGDHHGQVWLGARCQAIEAINQAGIVFVLFARADRDVDIAGDE